MITLSTGPLLYIILRCVKAPYISSSRDRTSQPQTESYTAAKGGIAALTYALAITFAGKARVNSISLVWIDTKNSDINGADAV